MVQIRQEGLKLNITHQILVYAGGVNILSGNLHTVKKNTKILVVASKENGLEVNGEKINYMIMFYDHNMKVGNASFERV